MKKRRLRRSLAVAAAGSLGAVTLAAATATAASAQTLPGALHRGPTSHAVFVQTNNPAGNQIDVFDAGRDGRLSLRQAVGTGGLGGQAAGSMADHLASQHSLVYDPSHGLLFAVNAGSNTLSVLATWGHRARLLQVVPSGGTFPDSVAVHGDLVYVLNAGGAGSVSGYRLLGHHLVALRGSTRTLGLGNTTPPFFLTAPGEVGFSPDGSKLVVTTKGSTNSLDVYGVGRDGSLTATPTVTTDGANVPFSFVYTPAGQMVVAGPGSNSLQTFAFGAGGTLTSVSAPVSDNQSALCWVTTAGKYYYVDNTGSGTVSGYTVTPGGTPTLLDGTGLPTATASGPVDLVASPDGRSLYVQSGPTGTIDEFHVNTDGSLTSLGSVAGLGVGIEGIATS